MESHQIVKVFCIKCSHEWIPRSERIFVCPSCKNPRWNDCLGEQIIKGSKSLSPTQILKIIIANPILSDELRKIGMVNHERK
jgi:hypothetical protein